MRTKTTEKEKNGFYGRKTVVKSEFQDLELPDFMKPTSQAIIISEVATDAQLAEDELLVEVLANHLDRKPDLEDYKKVERTFRVGFPGKYLLRFEGETLGVVYVETPENVGFSIEAPAIRYIFNPEKSSFE